MREQIFGYLSALKHILQAMPEKSSRRPLEPRKLRSAQLQRAPPPPMSAQELQRLEDREESVLRELRMCVAPFPGIPHAVPNPRFPLRHPTLLGCFC